MTRGRNQILQRLASDSNNVVARLACVSAMLVYKDLAPGYRIRPPTDKELEMAVSKEVRATRDYETAFLKGELTALSDCLALLHDPTCAHAAQHTKAFCSCCFLLPEAQMAQPARQQRTAQERSTSGRRCAACAGCCRHYRSSTIAPTFCARWFRALHPASLLKRQW